MSQHTQLLTVTGEYWVNLCAEGHADISVEGKHFIIQLFPCGPVIGAAGTKEPLVQPPEAL